MFLQQKYIFKVFKQIKQNEKHKQNKKKQLIKFKQHINIITYILTYKPTKICNKTNINK